MSKKSDTKKQVVTSKGFTLVELLATIAVLSLICTIVIYVATNAVSSAKEKSYKVTINNIEDEANSYAIEDNDLVPWMNGITSTYQYQCITVQNLIDAGYFKGDVLDSYVAENVKVQANNYIYLERDRTNKTVTKKVLLVGDRLDVYGGLCDNISTEGNISFTVSPSGWATSKDIIINYDIYNNRDKASNYKYDYVYGSSSLSNNFNKLSMEEKLTVVKNGTLYATIKDKDNKLITNNTLVVSKIDNENPVAEITATNNVASEQIATLKMTDNAGIVAYYFGKSNPKSSNVTWTEITETKSKELTANVNSSGTWYLGVKDVVGHVVVVNKVFYQTTLSISNATISPTKVITMSGNSFTLPKPTMNAYYSFNGWYTSSSFSGSAITSYKPVSNATIYGKTTENKLDGGSVLIKGNNTYGETLTTELTDTTPKADKYAYQWYYNSSNSTNGGTKISGATSSTYTIGKGLVGKYIYVVVTATKDNYRSRTFSDITDPVAKRTITVTAGSKTKEYDGKALTNSSCTASNLVSGDSVTCTMTSGSTITNVGSVDNVINTVTIKNSSTDVASNYEVTKVNGKLTITKKNAVIPVSNSYCKSSLVYNGSVQTLTNAAGTGYSFSGNTGTNAGSYTVTATLNSNYIWSDETTADKTFSCSIGKADPTMTVDPASLTLSPNSSKSSGYTYNGDGNLSCSSSNTAVATCSVDTTGKKVNVTPTGHGTATITLSASAGTNYNATSKTITASVNSSYTITYVANGGQRADKNTNYCTYNGTDTSGTTSDSSCSYGESCTLRTNGFTRQCHKFLGWSTDPDATEATYTDGYTFDSYNFQNGLTLYAVWQNDHDWSLIGNQLYSTGDDFECGHYHTYAYGRYCSKCHMSLAHYNHCYRPDSEARRGALWCPCSWDSRINDKSLNSEGKNIVSSIYVIRFGGIVEGNNKLSTVSGSTSYYYCDEHPHYTITYNINGGTTSSLPSPSSEDKIKYQDLTLSSTKPTRTGYNFSGWNTKSDGSGTSYSAGGTYTENANATLYAQWSAKTYTVTLNKQSGTGGTSYIYGTYNSGVYTDSARTTKMSTSSNKITVPTRTGYTFGGYYTSTGGSGTQLISSSGYITSSFTSTKYSSSVTLYAKWTANNYTVTLNKQSGTGGTSYIYGTYNSGVYTDSARTTKMGTSSNAITKPTRTGYTFGGYYTSTGGSGTQLISSSGYITSSFTSTKYSSSVTLYAKWTAGVYTITLNNQSATTAGTTAIYLKYNSGVYKNSACTTKMTTSSNAITKPTKNKTFLGIKTGTYTFSGYYTSTGCSGTQLINSSGNITSSFTSTKYSSGTTLYACWE